MNPDLLMQRTTHDMTYKVDGFLDKCKDRLPPDSGAQLTLWNLRLLCAWLTLARLSRGIAEGFLKRADSVIL